MTNRARPTWPDGAADNAKTQSPQGGNGKAPSTPPAAPTSNGRSNNGRANGSQPRPAQNGQQSADFRPQQRPANQGGPSKPTRPPQQPPVRPAAQQPGGGHPGATANPGQSSPSTPGRPEPRFPAGSPSQGQPAQGYGQVGKVSAPSAAPKQAKTADSFGDRVTAAKQAVLDKAAAVKEAASAEKDKPQAAAESAPRPTSRGQVRKARLRLSRLDPWSVMKTSFLLSIAFGIVLWVAVFIVWSAIGAAGVFDNINNTVSEVLGTPSAEPFRIENYINTGKVMGFTTLLACADVLIITALATLGSFLYNIAATLLGGLEVTLASED
ncbi:transmembrane protein DUF3566 [Kribbella amoyensis]|uniref:Transmembrane protein DUF3566 n=1 Tax=Kribbella amoyensis TaxID=996641 RepID=A0A561BP01_9ACTN|nr:DUF3566 domain-containing protein [Kribbella amoyensis]TWD80606.1 transmembrane protein DUF3566 [Kribbella amoyensis]